MKRWKKIALVLLALAVLSQVPFAYRRYRLRRLAAATDALNASREGAAPDERFDEYAGVFHVHSSLGGHSTGTLEEIVRAAKDERLAVVLMTGHPSARPRLDATAPNPPLQELVARARSEGRLAVVGYPEEVSDPRLDGYDGIEVY